MLKIKILIIALNLIKNNKFRISNRKQREKSIIISIIIIKADVINKLKLAYLK